MEKKFDFKKFLSNNAIIILIILLALFVGCTTQNFFTETNGKNLLLNVAPRFIIACGVSGCLITKGTDLSAGRQVGLAACFSAMLLQSVDYSARMLPWLPDIPWPVALLIVMAVASIIAGGIWGLVPAFCKARWGTNETLFTLMLNYIAIGIEAYLQNGPWKDPSGTGFPIIAMFDQKARLPKVGGVHIGWIIVLALTVGMFIYMKYSKHGYEISVVGESQRTARYAGMNVGKIIMRTMFLSGAIAGLMGFLVVSGADYTLNNGTSGGVGFTAIIVAWLAHLNPFAMVLIAGLLAVLTKGSNTIQTNFKIPASAADVLSAIILFFMLGCEFFINYRMIFRGSKAKVPAGPAPATPAASPDTAEKEADEHE